MTDNSQPSKPKPRLLWCWPESVQEDQQLRDLLASFASVETGIPTQDEFERMLPDFDIVVPRLSHQLTETMVTHDASRLALIGTPSTGSDHIAVAAATARGINTVTLKEEREFLDTVQATAELAWLLLLACQRRLREALQQTQSGQWSAQAIRGHEMIGGTLGIIGYGRLGSMVSRFAHAFRMRVIATDPKSPIADPWVEQMDLHDLLQHADMISLHVHLSEQTHEMIDADAFAHMKRGMILVNTSRGGLIDEQAMLQALQDGTLAAAGLDVINAERSTDRADDPLLCYAKDHPNLIITPHMGGCTVESQRKAFIHFARLLKSAWQQHELYTHPA